MKGFFMVNIHLDIQSYDYKPINKIEISKISTRICKEISNISMKELANKLSNGHTMVLGIMKDGKRKKVNLEYQEVVALDFDDGVTIEQIKNTRFIQDNASFIYTTFSHTKDNPKCRVVFKLSDRLISNNQIESLYKDLFNRFPKADISCKDSSRLFYGGLEQFEVNYNNELDSSYYASIEPTEDISYSKPKSKSLRVKSNSDNENIDLVDRPTWWLIRGGFDDIVKDRLSEYKCSLSHQAQAMEHLKTLNMGDVLDLPTDRNFYDLFTHDEKPSANIYCLKDTNVWLYTRHSSDKEKHFTGSIIQVVQRLKNTHFMGALMYLIEMTEIDFNVSSRMKKLINEIEVYSALLQSPDLKKTYPHIAKIFRDGRSSYSGDVVQILNIIKTNVIEIDGELRMISQLSTRELSERLYGVDNKRDRISRVINLMATTDWIMKLETDKLPNEIKQKLLKHQKSNNRAYRKNVLEFEELGNDFFVELNKLCEVLHTSGFTVTGGLNKEAISMWDSERADKVYNQDTDRKVSKLTSEVEQEALRYMHRHIEHFGYVEERQVKTHLAKTLGKSLSDYKFKQLRSKFINDYGLDRHRLNKELKMLFNVSDKYEEKQAPVIYTISD